MKNKRLNDDIILMAGYWEPDTFIIRGGRSDRNIEEDNYPYSEEMAAKLSRLGITLAVWPFYKGIGIKTEQETMDRTAGFFRHLEKYGIHKGTYVNLASVFVDTFFQENPEMWDHLAYDQYGAPHFYSEFYRIYYRYRICTSHLDFGRYVASAALKAVNEAGTDLVFFDNSAQMPCYCEQCKIDFPQYILSKFPANPEDCAEGQLSFKQRFGHEYMGTFQMPKGTARMPVDVLPSAHEPGLYEWVRFRQSQAETLHKLVFDTVRENDEDTAISWNFALDEGEFTPLLWGLDPDSAFRLGSDLFFSEDSNHAGIEHGNIISHLRSFKYAHAMDQRLFVHNTPEGGDKVKFLNFTEAAAFNAGCVGRVMWGTEKEEDCAEIARSARFLKAHKDLYLNSEPKTKLAIYRSNHSETMAFADEAVSRLAIEQTLIEESIQFDYVINDTLDRIGRYEAIVLPNAVCVSDAAAEALAEYVRSGGRLLCTEGSLTKDEYGRKRVAVADMGLYGERDTSIGRTNAASDVDHLLYCLGLDASYSDRIVYLKKVIPEKPFVWKVTSAEPVVIGKEYYRRPQNAEQVLEAVRAVIGEDFVSLANAEQVIAGVFTTEDGRTAVHLFDHACRDACASVKVNLRFEDLPTELTLVTKEGESKLPVRRDANGAFVNLPAFCVYACLVF